MLTVTPNTIEKNVKDFYISLNKQDIQHYGNITTAIYINSTSQFLILNGNHTKEYKECKGLKETLNYFYNNIDKVNKFSEHKKIFSFKNGKAEYIKGGF